VHISTSSAAGSLEHADTPCGWRECKPPPFTAFRAIHHGYLRFSVQPRLIRVEAHCVAEPGRDDIHCADGDIFDKLTLDEAAVAAKR
jgi:hypothetical protein